MAINVKCECGKRMGLSEALIGKTVKCPNCGQGILVKPSPQAGAAKPDRQQSAGPAIAISGGTIALVVILGLIVGVGLLFYFGPVRVSRQWDGMKDQANHDVRDVVDFALRGYLSQIGMYDPTDPHMAPALDGDINYERPLFSLSMPEKIKFFGKSNQGDFTGYYYTQTGEIEADIGFGGYAVAGLVDIRKPIAAVHITGREKDGQPQAENNGVKIVIVYPPKIQP